jgi:hypothetical protein
MCLRVKSVTLAIDHARLRTIMNHKRHRQREIKSRRRVIRQAKVDVIRIVDDLAPFVFALHVFMIAGEMAVRLQPTIPNRSLPFRIRRHPMIAMDTAQTSAARGHTALGR